MVNKERVVADKKTVGGHVIACLTQMMWGATFISTKVLVEYFQPVEVLVMRVLLALAVLFIVYPKVKKVENWKREGMFALAALTGIVFYFMLENTALTYAYASVVGIIVSAAPFFVALVVGIFFKTEKLTRFFFMGFVVSMLGIVIVSLNGQGGVSVSPIGVILSLFAMVSWGFYSAIVKKIETWGYNVIMVTRRIYIYALIFLIPVSLVQKSTFPVHLLIEKDILVHILFLGICGSAVGFLLWNLATKWIGAIKTSVYIYVSPVVTLFLSVIILDEKLTAVSIGGVCLILAGLVLAQKNK